MSDKNGMHKLWAPWRMKYIEGIDSGDTGGCIFCDKPAADDDRANFILHRSERCFIIMNIFPYSNGHIMAVPYLHTADIGELDADTRLDLMNCVQLAIDAMTRTMRPDGFNIGMNLGRTAGAGIDEHIHMHVVPRWNGDTNFMPVIGCCKVISESLEDTWEKLRHAIVEITGGA